MNRAARFSMNAEMPSRASSEPNTSPKARFSASIPASRSADPGDALDLANGERRLRRELARPGERGVEQFVVGDEAVGEPDLVRLLGADRIADQVHLERLRGADEAREALRAAEAGDDPEADLRLAEAGRLRRDPEVAGHRQLAAAAERGPPTAAIVTIRLRSNSRRSVCMIADEPAGRGRDPSA